MVFHAVTVPTHVKSVALSTLLPSLPNKRHFSDVSQTVAPPTFVNCRTSDEMWFDVWNIALLTPKNRHNSDPTWSDVLDVALPTFVRCRNSDEMWSDVLNVALPTFVSCRNSNEMWSNVLNAARPTFLYCRSSEVFKLSQFRHLQGVGIPTAGSI